MQSTNFTRGRQEGKDPYGNHSQKKTRHAPGGFATYGPPKSERQVKVMDFSYQAKSWTRSRRVVCKLE
jgi:hypothetical protein